MANIVLEGDMSQGVHCNPVAAIATQGITCNGKKLITEGDPYQGHCGHVPTAVGTRSVTINGRKIIVDGDQMSCGDISRSTSTISIS